MRNGRNTNNEFSLVLHKFIAPAGEKKTRTDRDTERLINRETERQKEEEGVGGGVVDCPTQLTLYDLDLSVE